MALHTLRWCPEANVRPSIGMSVEPSSLMVKRARISLIAFQDLGPDLDSPRRAHETAWAGALEPSSLFTVPWLNAGRADDGKMIRLGSNACFWRRYLQCDPVPEERAFHCFLPLRRRQPLQTLRSACKRIETSIEGHWYPTSVAVVATAHFKSDDGLALSELIPRLVQWRRGDRAVDDALRNGLGQLVKEVGHRESSAIEGRCASIATIIHATKPADTTLKQLESIEPDSMLHRALDGLWTLDELWHEAATGALSPKTLWTKQGDSPLRLRLEGKVTALYAPTPRDRVVWAPHLCFSSLGQHGSLGAYHRNLVLTMLQAEALLRQLKRRSQAGFENKLNRKAVTMLSRLYGGGSNIHHSASAFVHIEPFLTKLNEYRKDGSFRFEPSNPQDVEIASRMPVLAAG